MPPDDPRDQPEQPDQPDPIAVTDQTIASMEQVSRAVWAYFEDLIGQGFRRSEALQLTLQYQGALLMAGSQPDEN